MYEYIPVYNNSIIQELDIPLTQKCNISILYYNLLFKTAKNEFSI